MKYLYTILLFTSFWSSIIPDPFLKEHHDLPSDKIDQRDSLVYVYGKLKMFPSGHLAKELKVSVYKGDTSYNINATYKNDGEFSFKTDKSDPESLRIDLYDPTNTRFIQYYPINIENVNFDTDTVFLGFIPVLIDTFGYWTEWGTSVKQNIFDKKVHFNTTEIYNMEQRLIHEGKLNKVYDSYCEVCDSIFFTDHQYTQIDKRHFISSENRKFTIDHQELLLLTPYFDFNYNRADSLTFAFINFMKRVPDSLFCDRFNKTVRSFGFPSDYITPDSIIILPLHPRKDFVDEDSVPIIAANRPELPNGLFEMFKKDILKAVQFSEEEKAQINHQLVFYIKVDRIGVFEEIKLLSLVGAENRHLIDPVMDKFRGIKLTPPRSRGKPFGFEAAWYIDL